MSRTEANTPESVNQRIRHESIEVVGKALQGGPAAIDERLAELDGEWDVERVLETTASSLVLAGLGLSVAVSRRWLVLPAVVGGFLLQHAIQGWCPPLPIVRALGFRTHREIERERTALRASRGDFDDIEAARAAGPNTLLAVAESLEPPPRKTASSKER